MLTPDQFFGKYDQKGIDFDGYYGFQCVDLYRQYVRECKGFPQSPGVVGAKDIWNTYLPQYFERIDNTPINCPIKGDIIIWGFGLSEYGHVAICKNADPMGFTSFDQNWPVGSLCHFQLHSYTNVLGWLRAKEPVTLTTVSTTSSTSSSSSTTITTPMATTYPLQTTNISSLVLEARYNAFQEVIEAISSHNFWYFKYRKIKKIVENYKIIFG
jgi:hypothetical protein